MENEVRTDEQQIVAQEQPKKRKCKPILIGIIAVVVAIVIAGATLIYLNLPSTIYMKAKKNLLQGNYDEAITYFMKVIEYKDSEDRIKEAYLGAGTELVKAKEYDKAVEMLENIDSSEMCSEAYLMAGNQLIADKEYDKAVEMLEKVNSPEMCSEAYLTAGNQLIADKDYDKAVEMLGKVNSPEKSSKAYLTAGIQMIADNQYAEALEMLANSTEEETANYTKYAKAMNSLIAEDFDAAISAFIELGDFENCTVMLNATYYQKAEKLYGGGSYAIAKNTYERTTGYDDVPQKILNCELMLAEELYVAGDLKKAQEAFQKLPSDLSFNNVTVFERLDTLQKNAGIVALCGSWKGTEGKMTVRQTHDSTGLWDQWDANFTDTLTLKVVINNDGTYTFKGSAKYYIYTNYSSLSRYLKTLEMTETFSVTGNTLPKELSSGSLVKVTHNNGKIKLDFVLVDKNSSANFTYKYTSSITYNIG